jgi:hypothetical protein
MVGGARPLRRLRERGRQRACSSRSFVSRCGADHCRVPRFGQIVWAARPARRRRSAVSHGRISARSPPLPRRAVPGCGASGPASRPRGLSPEGRPIGHPPGTAMPLERAGLEHGMLSRPSCLGVRSISGLSSIWLASPGGNAPGGTLGSGCRAEHDRDDGFGVGIVYVGQVPATVCTVDPRAPPTGVDPALAERRHTDRDRVGQSARRVVGVVPGAAGDSSGRR